MFLTDLSIKKPVFMTIILIALTIFGLVSYNKLSLDLYPEVDIPVVMISTEYKGAGPEEVETLITDKIEESVSSINGIDKIESTSQEGFSLVSIRFEYEIDVDIAGIDVKDKVDLIRAALPDDAEQPIVQKLDINALPIMYIAVNSKKLNLEDLYHEVDEYVKDDLNQIAGVADVNISGGKEREIQILVKQKALEAHNISIPELITAIKRENLNLPSGHITEKHIEYNIRVDSEFKTINDIKNIKLSSLNGTIYLNEIAKVIDFYEEEREKSRMNNEPVIGISIKKRSEANTVDTAKAVRKKLEKIKKKYKNKMDFVIVSDSSEFIKDSVDDVNSNILMAIIITGIVLFFFLQNLRSTFIISIAMPVSIIATFIVIQIFNFTINMMTLMALALAVGMLVNNGIVVLENIDRHILKGDTPKNAARTGTNEIALAIFGATFTNVVVFVPIGYMGGIVGQFFKQFGLTMAFITLLSLYISYTLTPMMCAFMLKPKHERKPIKGMKTILDKWNKYYNKFELWYKNTLSLLLNHGKLTLFITGIIFICSLFLFPLIGAEFIAKTDEGTFQINIEMPAGTSLEETNNTIKQAEQILDKKGGVEYMFTSVGTADVSLLQGSNSGVNVAQIMVNLEKIGETEKYMNDIRKKIQKIAGPQKFSVLQAGRHGPGGSPLSIEILGDDIEVLNKFSEKIKEIVKNNPYTVDTESSLTFGKPELKIIPKRHKMKEFNIDPQLLADTMRASVEGIPSTVFREKGKEYDIIVKLDENFLKYAQDISKINIISNDGRKIGIKQIADIKLTEGPTRINRKDRRKMVLISGDVTGKSIGKVAQMIKKEFEKITIPEGCEINFGGEIEKMKENFAYLFEAMWLAIILTYLLIAAILESFKKPVFIMMTLPLGLVGAFIILFLTNTSFSIFSLMAFIMLVGIVVNNAILILDYVDTLRKKGMNLHDAIMEACPTKLRPILMTVLTTIFAMIPLALGLGSGGEIRRPMAIVSIGGITSNLFLSIFIIPVVYYLIEKE